MRYVDYPVTDVLQMMGRAGRPQFDTKGIACVMVEVNHLTCCSLTSALFKYLTLISIDKCRNLRKISTRNFSMNHFQLNLALGPGYVAPLMLR